jgi:2-dehydro-3-deoxy-D-arabinonate dehydratase
MRLVQFFLPGKGKRVGLLRGDSLFDISHAEEGIGSSLDLLQQGKTAAGLLKRAEWLARTLRRRALDWRELQRPPSRRLPHVLIPVDAPEIWTLRPARGPAGPRPAIFFKATASRCAGPGAPVTARADSRSTRLRAGLGLILSAQGEVLALTGYLGLSADDLALEHPLFLSQAETYGGCCALGPCLVSLDEVEVADRLQMRLSLLRHGGAGASDAFRAGPLAELRAGVPWLLQDNACPTGTILAVEVGVSAALPALESGDRVELEVQAIGRVGCPVRTAGARDRGTKGGGPA